MTYLHIPQFPMNGTELECDGAELRPDGTCVRCERVNERIEAKLTAVRKDTRATAFEDVISVVMQRGEIIHRGNLIAALEAAANTEEGGGKTLTTEREQLVKTFAVNQEALNEAGERWDDDYGLDPRAQPTAGADGRYCTHHDDDPAHGKECYEEEMAVINRFLRP